jgi:hypothetical protein
MAQPAAFFLIRSAPVSHCRLGLRREPARNADPRLFAFQNQILLMQQAAHLQRSALSSRIRSTNGSTSSAIVQASNSHTNSRAFHVPRRTLRRFFVARLPATPSRNCQAGAVARPAELAKIHNYYKHLNLVWTSNAADFANLRTGPKSR